MLGSTMVMEKWRFWRQETKGRPKVLNKAAKIFLKEARLKEEIWRGKSHNSLQVKSRAGSWETKVGWQNKTSAQSAKQRSAPLKFVKKY